MTTEIDTFNKFMVGMNGGYIVIMNPPKPGYRLSKDEALLLASYLVTMTFDDARFAEIFKAIQAT